MGSSEQPTTAETDSAQTGSAKTGDSLAPKKASFAEFVILMAFMISLIAMAIDAMLPALGLIVDDLAVANRNDAQFVVAILFAGMAVGQIAFGPLSESTGRKLTVYIGLALFISGGIIAALAPTFEILLFARFLQGVGGAAGQIIAFAMVRDRCAGREMARVLSLVMGVFIMVPAIAPTIGQSILFVFGDWRAIFVMLTLQGLVCFLLLRFRVEETLPVERRRPYRVKSVLRALREVVTTPVTIGYTLCSGCVFGGIISYVTSAQQIFQELYDTGSLFPLFFGMIALTIGIASFINSTLVRRLGMRRLVGTGLTGIFCLSGLFLIYQTMDATPPLALFVIFAMATFFCVGTLFGNLNAMAMEPMGHIAGTAAAAVNCISTVISVTVGTLIAQSYDGSVLPLTLGLFCLSIIAGIVMVVTERLRGNEPDEAAATQ